MRTRRVTRSSAASSQVKIGFGITEQTNTWKVLDSHRRSTIRSTSLYQDQPDGSPPIGKTFWWNRDLVRDEAPPGGEFLAPSPTGPSLPVDARFGDWDTAEGDLSVQDDSYRAEKAMLDGCNQSVLR